MALTRRTRIVLASVAGVLLLAIAAALVFLYVFLRPERFTETLRNAAAGAGLELTLTAPAHPTLWPKPGVQLEGLQLFVQGQADPILIANHGRIVVPWRTLLGGPTAITKLELDSPRLDLDQLRAALAQVSSKQGKAPSLPGIDAGVSIRDGTLVSGNKLLLKSIGIQTGALKPGSVFRLDLSATRPSGQAMSMKLQFTPRKSDKGIDLEDIRIHAQSGTHTRMKLGGRALWHGGADLQLALSGTMHVDPDRDYTLELDSVAGGTPPAGQLHVKLDGPSDHADVKLSPQALAAWWQKVAGDQPPGPLPQPPLDGTVEASELDLGPMQIKGLKLRTGSAVPAQGSTAAAPAKSSK